MKPRSRPSAKYPEKQLARFIARYSPAIAATARDALARLRDLLPGATQMVYDNYNALVIGFGPTVRPSDAILSLALYPRWVNVYFLYGVNLRDPQKILLGSGNQVRYVTLKTAADLDAPALREVIADAVARCDPALGSVPSQGLIIRSVSAKQRPRRPKPE